MKKNKKKGLILALVIFVLAAAGLGIWYYLGHNSSEPVYVYPFEYLGMTEYWGDSQESYGPVTTDRIQTIFLSDTQTVTEVLVQQGDTVKKGEVLMTFDTTLSDLALERKRLDVEKLKLQLQDAQKELREINSMKPMVIPTYDEEPEEDENLGASLGAPYRISEHKDYDGSSKEKALVLWLSGEANLDDALLEAIRVRAEEFQNYNAQHNPPQTEEPEPPEEAPEGEPAPEGAPGEEAAPSEEEEVPSEGEENPGQGEELPGEGETTPTEEEPYVPFAVYTYHVIVKVTEGDMSLGGRRVWQGLKVTGSGSDFAFKFFTPTIADYTVTEEGGVADVPQIDFGSGYTAAQIAQMRAEQEKKIKDLEFQIKMAEADYKIAQTEASDGKVYATIDGEVVSLLTEEEAKEQMQPFMKVSGGGGFYVEGFVSELEKDNLVLGQEVTINDWQTGMTHVGTIESVGDFPTPEGYYNGLGNPVASYFPFRVFIDGSVDLQEGRYVSVMYSVGTAESGIYLQNPFLRTENGKSYVYLQGEDGKLEKRYVTTGKALWGSYTEILSGMTEEDLLAFPYGKNVKEGVPVVQGDYSNMYE